MDEERTDLGRDATADLGNLGVPEKSLPEQVALLAELIGEHADALWLARHLISSFGSLGRVIAAEPQAIDRLVGEPQVGRRIVAARAAVLAGQQETIERAPFDLRDVRLQRYIVALFQGADRERLHVIYLDASHRYLTDERVSQGSCGAVSGSLRDLVGRAIFVGAAGLVLAHNHPSGDSQASEADVATTRALARSLAGLELTLVDHLIVGGTTIHSMRGSGLL